MKKKTWRMKTKRRPLVATKGFWLGILTLIVVCSLVYALFFSPLFELREIRVAGVKTLSKDELKQKVVFGSIPFETASNILLFKGEETAKGIRQEFPKVASVKVQRVSLHAVEIVVSERSEVLVWCGDRCFATDNMGVAFEEVEGPGALTLYGEAAELRDSVLAPERVVLILAVKDSLENLSGMKEANITIPSLKIVSEQTVQAMTSEAWEVYVSTSEDIAWQVSKFEAVFDRELTEDRRARLEYVDVRFGDRAYLK